MDWIARESGASIAMSLGLVETLRRCPPLWYKHTQMVIKSYLPQKTENYRPHGSFRTATLDHLWYQSALARRPTDWTCQPVNTKRYKVFTTFFMPVYLGITGAMDSTMRHHQLKLMVKNNTKSKPSGSIGMFVRKCSIWWSWSDTMSLRTYGLLPVN